jgi:DNA-binding FadR family transcriptional regulator
LALGSSRTYARVSGDLARRISEGEYEIGTRLPPERELAQRYGVSRPTMREAIIALEVDGLVETRQGSGIYVSAQKPQSGVAGDTDIGPFELLEARRSIEGEICAVAATRITDEEVGKLEALLQRMNSENLIEEIVQSERADRAFHLLIAEATRNSAMIAAFELLWDSRTSSPQSKLLSQKAHAAGVKPRVDEHTAIVDALRARDSDQARMAMRAHLNRVITTLLEVTEVHELAQARERIAAKRELYADRT